VLIVGGGPAGAAAAVYAARKGIRTGIVAERFGGQTLDTLGIENFISVPETEGPKFAAALEAHVRHYDVDADERCSASSRSPRGRSPAGWHRQAGQRRRAEEPHRDPGHRRALAQHERARRAEYRTKGVAYCPHCDGPLFKGKDVAVIGGGNSGVEAAIDLAGVVRSVTVLEFMPTSSRPTQVLVDKLKSLPNVTVHLNAQTTEVTGDGQKMTACAGRTASAAPSTHRAGRRVRADRPGAQHRVPQGHGGAQPLRRDRGRRQVPHQRAGRLRPPAT
jgi:alkyl hydroperoxide reductase subunit F